MKIKEHILPYYHQLYRKLKTEDRSIHQEPVEDVVNLYIEDLIRLDAFISLLVYVDGTLPLIRCQKSLARILKEIRSLQYLFRERRYLMNTYDKYFNWNMGYALEVGISDGMKDIKSSADDIYLNAIHAGEKAISNHMITMTEEKIIVGILAHFKETISLIREQKSEAMIYEIGFGARTLLANLKFIAYLNGNHDRLQNMPFYSLLKSITLKTKILHVQDMTIKSLSGSHHNTSDTLSEKLQKEYSVRLENINDEVEKLIRDDQEIIDYVTFVLLKENKEIEPELIKMSIQARNLLYSLS